MLMYAERRQMPKENTMQAMCTARFFMKEQRLIFMKCTNSFTEFRKIYSYPWATERCSSELLRRWSS